MFKGTGGNAFIGLQDVDSAAGFVFVGAEDGDMVFQTPGNSYSTKMSIKSDGKIGIGTTNAGSLLHLGSNTDPALTIEDYDADGVVSLSQVNSGQFDITNNATEKDITFNLHNGTLVQEALRIASDGNVGINQNNPNKAKLHVVADTGSTEKIVAKFRNPEPVADNKAKIGLVAGYSDTANDLEAHAYVGVQREGSGNNSALFFETSNGSTVTENLRITSEGNIGIGTQVPTDPATSANATVTSVGILTAYKIYGDISGASGYVTDKIAEDDSSVEVIDSGSDGRIVATVAVSYTHLRAHET